MHPTEKKKKKKKKEKKRKEKQLWKQASAFLCIDGDSFLFFKKYELKLNWLIKFVGCSADKEHFDYINS